MYLYNKHKSNRLINIEDILFYWSLIHKHKISSKKEINKILNTKHLPSIIRYPLFMEKIYKIINIK